MSKIITFTELKIKNVLIDVESKKISVSYVMRDESGQYFRSGTAVFVRPLPTEPDPLPDDIFLIPAARAAEVLGLVTDIKAAMEAKLLS